MDAGREEDRARLADLDAQILSLEFSLSTLRAQKARVQRRLYSYKYPVLTLPNEIVSEIFLRFVPVYPLCPPLTGTLSPTLLTHICRRWREIALATPMLWRGIMLSSVDYNAALDSLQGHICAMWLSRSGCCPLSIQMDGNDVDEVVAISVLPAILSHCARWEYLKLCLSPSDLRAIEGPMPLLRHLSLVLQDYFGNKPASFDVPLLRTVVLNDQAALGVILPWAQLTSLTLKHVYPHECVPILQQTSNLLHCELELFAFGGDGHPFPDIPFPRLESLVLKDPVYEAVIGFLNTFIVPTLRRLEIPEYFLGPDPLDSLASFISKSGCKLQEVRITGDRELYKSTYRHKFPLIWNFCFEDEEDSDATSSDADGVSNSQ
ncbi:hypothetical protein B0H19DRAFT_1103680 [Mycena capillaripes]|nr:hypothetical protein B0H19DRAFT_1103680 [Mycena capillaripes]